MTGKMSNLFFYKFYANSLMMNHQVLVCLYGRSLEKYDEEAQEVYRQALPDHEVAPIDCSILANGGGGINCSSYEIPDITEFKTGNTE